VDSAASQDYARIVRARLAWSRGNAAEALRQLGGPRLPANRTLPMLWEYTVADERFLRAELLQAAGRNDEALRVLASFPDPQGYDLHYLAPAHLRRAEIH
jgi:hypothetical protein